MNARTEWLTRRQQGLGGSDIAGILGLSPWNTPLDIYNSKVTPVVEAEDVQNEPMYWGNVMEEVVAKEYATRTGKKVQRVNALLKHSEFPFLIANIDRAIVAEGTRARAIEDGKLLGASGLLECKTASAYVAGSWGTDTDEDAIPLHYQCQAMHYLNVTGQDYCDFAVLIGGNKFMTKRLERDEEVIRDITAKCEEFWFKHVVVRVPPDPSNVADVLKLFPKDNGQVIQANAGFLDKLNTISRCKAEIKDIEDVMEEAIASIKFYMGGATAIAIDDKKLVTWAAVKDSLTTDWKALAAELKPSPDLVAKFTTTKPGSRRFLIK